MNRFVLGVGIMALVASMLAPPPSARATPICPAPGATISLEEAGQLTACPVDTYLLHIDGDLLARMPAPGEILRVSFARRAGAPGEDWTVTRDRAGSLAVDRHTHRPGSLTSHDRQHLLAAPSSCGSSTDFSVSGPKWSGGLYQWWYNPERQPSSAALTVIKNALAAIVADVSPCGPGDNTAKQTYLGQKPGVVIGGGSDDGRSVIGWSAVSADNLAVTISYASGGYYTSADIRINSKIPWFVSTGTTGCSARHDLHSVVLHEAGHAFGLGHAPQRGGPQVMEEAFAPCEMIRYKRAGDLAAMAYVY